MSYTLAENWDSVTPPALPGGWNTDAGYATSTTYSATPPNSLKLGTYPGNVAFATNSSSDPGSGYAVDLTGFLYFEPTVSSGDSASAGVTLRCSAATMDNSTTSCYWIRVSVGTGGSNTLKFSKIVNGVVSDLVTVTNTDSGLTRGFWYSIHVVCYGSDLFNVSLTRISDGYSFNSSGAFVSSSVSAITTTQSSIASGGYYGFASTVGTVIGNTNNKVYFDDILVNASPGIVLPPHKPVVVKTPHQYYIRD